MNTFLPNMAILPEAQKMLWPALHPAALLGFVLYGGTAIALRLGHRTSVDFDFFIEKTLDKDKIKAAFSFMPTATVLQDELETFTVLIKTEAADIEAYIKISFFGLLQFGRVGEPELTKDKILEVASLDDLMAHKLKVILQRVEAKDYLDIAALIKAGISIEKGLSAARAFYGPAFQASESLKALTYFNGGDLETLPSETKTVLISAASKVRALPSVEIISKKLSAHH